MAAYPELRVSFLNGQTLFTSNYIDLINRFRSVLDTLCIPSIMGNQELSVPTYLTESKVLKAHSLLQSDCEIMLGYPMFPKYEFKDDYQRTRGMIKTDKIPPLGKSLRNKWIHWELFEGKTSWEIRVMRSGFSALARKCYGVKILDISLINELVDCSNKTIQKYAFDSIKQDVPSEERGKTSTK